LQASSFKHVLSKHRPFAAGWLLLPPPLLPPLPLLPLNATQAQYICCTHSGNMLHQQVYPILTQWQPNKIKTKTVHCWWCITKFSPHTFYTCYSSTAVMLEMSPKALPLLLDPIYGLVR
jgi:hypothetical protein